MNYKLLLIGILLVGLLVGTVSATVVNISANITRSVYEDSLNEIFPTMRNADGDTLDSTVMFAGYGTTSSSLKFDYVARGTLTFPTGDSIPDAATITSATLTFFGVSKTFDFGIGSAPNITVIYSTPLNPLSIVATDYARTNFSRVVTSDITYSNFNITGENGTNTFTLNTLGLNTINKTTGVTTFMLDTNYSVDNQTPTWASSKYAEFLYRSTSYAGGIYAPVLSVTYSSGVTASFTKNLVNATIPQTYTFNDTSTNTPTTWAWYWYNNETVSSTSQNATAVLGVGSYDVRLNASSANGYDWENKTGEVSVGLAPIAHFYMNVSSVPVAFGTCTPRSGTLPLTVTCTDNSTNSPTNWSWSLIGDGGTYTSNAQNPVFNLTESVPGTYDTYDLTLTARNGAGASNPYSYHGYATYYTPGTPTTTPTTAPTTVPTTSPPPPPVANFAANRTTVRPYPDIDPIAFTDTSTNSPTSWGWCFGEDLCLDYSQSHLQNPIYTYLNPGDYTVILRAANAYGNDTEIKTNYIHVTSEGESYGIDTNPTGSPIGGGTGYVSIVTSGDYTATTRAELEYALSVATTGQTVFIPSTATIDLTARTTSLTIPAGVTLASDRGYDGHTGGLIKRDTSGTIPLKTLSVGGDNVRITGLRIQGPHSVYNGDYGDNVKAAIMTVNHYNLEVDNNEIYYWSYSGVAFENDEEGTWDGYVHHNSFHDIAGVGYGYGVMVAYGDVLIEGNTFDYMRHAVIMEACGNEISEIRYNNLGSHYTDGIFDIHRDCGGWTAGGVSGKTYIIHHNTATMNSNYALNIYGTPITGLSIYNNRFGTGILARNGVTRISMTNNYIAGTLRASGPIDTG